MIRGGHCGEDVEGFVRVIVIEHGPAPGPESGLAIGVVKVVSKETEGGVLELVVDAVGRTQAAEMSVEGVEVELWLSELWNVVDALNEGIRTETVDAAIEHYWAATIEDTIQTCSSQTNIKHIPEVGSALGPANSWGGS